MSSDEKNGKTPETLFLWMLVSKSSGDSKFEEKNQKRLIFLGVLKNNKFGAYSVD